MRKGDINAIRRGRQGNYDVFFLFSQKEAGYKKQGKKAQQTFQRKKHITNQTTNKSLFKIGRKKERKKERNQN